MAAIRELISGALTAQPEKLLYAVALLGLAVFSYAFWYILSLGSEYALVIMFYMRLDPGRCFPARIAAYSPQHESISDRLSLRNPRKDQNDNARLRCRYQYIRSLSELLADRGYSRVVAWDDFHMPYEDCLVTADRVLEHETEHLYLLVRFLYRGEWKMVINEVDMAGQNLPLYRIGLRLQSAPLPYLTSISPCELEDSSHYNLPSPQSSNPMEASRHEGIGTKRKADLLSTLPAELQHLIFDLLLRQGHFVMGPNVRHPVYIVRECDQSLALLKVNKSIRAGFRDRMYTASITNPLVVIVSRAEVNLVSTVVRFLCKRQPCFILYQIRADARMKQALNKLDTVIASISRSYILDHVHVLLMLQNPKSFTTWWNGYGEVELDLSCPKTIFPKSVSHLGNLLTLRRLNIEYSLAKDVVDKDGQSVPAYVFANAHVSVRLENIFREDDTIAKVRVLLGYYADGQPGVNGYTRATLRQVAGPRVTTVSERSALDDVFQPQKTRSVKLSLFQWTSI